MELLKVLMFILLCMFVEKPSSCSHVTNEYTQITTNFFVNLKHKYQTRDNATNQKRMHNEIELFRHFLSNKLTRKKRQYPHYHVESEMNLFHSVNLGIQMLNGFVQHSGLLISNILDVEIITQKLAAHNTDELFAAVLQEINYSTYIVFYKHRDNQWYQLFSQDIKNPNKIYSLPSIEGTLICVTHKHYSESNLGEGLTVFLLDDNIRLHFVQTLETASYNNIALWNAANGEIFLTFSSDHKQKDNYKLYEITSPVYIWKGHYFSFLQYIPVSNARSIVPFQVGLDIILGVANYQNNYGVKRIFSLIYKYDNDGSRFMNYQDLATQGAVDMLFFSFVNNDGVDYFLLVINEEIQYTPEYETISNIVIYKYEQKYFAPFQNFIIKGVTKWYKFDNELNKLALMCVTNGNDFKIFQYTGWTFASTTVDPANLHLPKEHAFMKITTLANGEKFLFTVDSSRTQVSLLAPTFRQQIDMENIKASLVTQCEEMKKCISCLDNAHDIRNAMLSIKMQKPPAISHIDSNRKKILLNGATVGKIITKTVISDDVHLDKTLVENLNNIYSLLEIQQASIQILEQNIEDKMTDNTLILHSLHVENLQMECDKLTPCQFDSIEIGRLNGFNIPEFQKDVFYKGVIYPYNHVLFREFIVENFMQLNTINNKSLAQLSLLDLVKHHGIHVKGNIYFLSGITVDGTLDNVTISEKTILLTNGDQVFDGDFQLDKINTITLGTESVNDLTMRSLKDILAHENKTYTTEYRTTTLTTDDIYVDGMINNVSVEQLFKDTLKSSGDQFISGSFSISMLETVDILNKKESLTDNIIFVDEGDYVLHQDVSFENMTAKSIMIAKRLNDIAVVKNEIQVLQLKLDEMQRVTGDKVFDYIELMGPLNLQGKINSPSLEKKNPVTMIEKPLLLTGNFIVNGSVFVEKYFKSVDLSDTFSKHSVKNISKSALKLTDQHVPVPVVLTQPLKVEHIQADMVNSVSPSSWVTTSKTDLTVITGKKTFRDLHIQGYCSIQNLTGVNIKELDKVLLKKYGDQNVFGSISVNSITANRIYSGNTILGHKSLEDIMTATDNIKIQGETVIHGGAAVLQELTTKSLTVNGFISGHNMNYILRDAVMLNSPVVELYGNYWLTEPLHTETLVSNKTFGLNTQEYYLNNLQKGHLILNYLQMEKPMFFREITFSSALNGIPKRDFGSNWLLVEGDQTVSAKQYFNVLSFMNDVNMEAGTINNINIQNLYNNIIWINNEKPFIPRVTFNNGLIVKGDMGVGGSINQLQFPQDFLLRSVPHGHQYIQGHKFISNLFVEGSMNAEYINGLSLTPLCKFVNLKTTDGIKLNLIIKGSLYLQGNNTAMLHGVDINHLVKNIWFSDVPPYITGRHHYKYMNIFSGVQGNILHKDTDVFPLSTQYSRLTNHQISGDFNAHNIINNDNFMENGTIHDGLSTVNPDNSPTVQ